MARQELINGMKGYDFRTSINENFIELYNQTTSVSIKTLYESNSDTNVFNDISKNKVDLISVTSEIDLDNIKTFDNADYLETINQELSKTSEVTFKKINITDGLDLKENVVKVNSNTIISDETVLLCDTSSNSITITLPDAISGEKYYVKKLNDNGDVDIIANDSALIEDQSTLTLTAKYASVTLVCDGTNWYVI
jgi:hypothetical protein